MEHSWTPTDMPEVSVTISDTAGLSLCHSALHPLDFRPVEVLGREILRLAEENRALKERISALAAEAAKTLLDDRDARIAALEAEVARFKAESHRVDPSG